MIVASRIFMPCVALMAVAGCAPSGPDDGSIGSASEVSTGVSQPCNSRTIQGAKRITLREAEKLQGRALVVCDAGRGQDGSTSFNMTTLRATETGSGDFASRVAFDGGPLPRGCSLSLSSKLYLLVDEEWVEGRQVGCPK